MVRGVRRTTAVLALVTFVAGWHSTSAEVVQADRATKVVMLGTATPLPDPDRQGPATAVVVNGTAYIVDAGTGIVRRAAAARARGIDALQPVKLRVAFLTHLHSDHTLGLADLILTPWTMGRTEPLELYGPAGTGRVHGHGTRGRPCRFEARSRYGILALYA